LLCFGCGKSSPADYVLLFNLLFKSELIVIAMAPKGNSQKDKSGEGVTLKIKQEIVEKSEMGGNTSVLAKEYGLSQSTVSTSCYIRAK
jgi:hypothetical protein